MPWFNVDDGFSNSKPVMKIPRRWRNACIGLWTLCGSWSAKELTDGHVPNAVLMEFSATPAMIKMLVDAGLWEMDHDGIIFRAWGKWQPLKQRVTSHRLAEAERKRKWRKAQHETYTEQGECDNVTGMSHRDTPVRPGGTHPGLRSDENGPSPSPSPSPLPSTTHLGTNVTLGGGSGGNPSNLPAQVSSSAAPAARGTRLKPDWMPPTEVIAQMRNDHPHLNLKAEHAKFIDYWTDQPGAKGRKIDWIGTWRNWMRRAAENTHNGHHINGVDKATQKALGYRAIGQKLIQDLKDGKIS